AFGLRMERFLHPGRRDLPDIDLKVDRERRTDVVGALAERRTDVVGVLAEHARQREAGQASDSEAELALGEGKVELIFGPPVVRAARVGKWLPGTVGQAGAQPARAA